MTEHFCDFHATKFFKTEKMSGYAHPIKDKNEKTVGWCNEDAKEVAKLEPREKESPPHVPGKEEILPAPAPQAVGMITKELGDMIRAEKLTAIFGVKVGGELTRWYRNQTLGITRISYDGADLPKFK